MLTRKDYSNDYILNQAAREDGDPMCKFLLSSILHKMELPEGISDEDEALVNSLKEVFPEMELVEGRSRLGAQMLFEAATDKENVVPLAQYLLGLSLCEPWDKKVSPYLIDAVGLRKEKELLAFGYEMIMRAAFHPSPVVEACTSVWQAIKAGFGSRFDGMNDVANKKYKVNMQNKDIARQLSFYLQEKIDTKGASAITTKPVYNIRLRAGIPFESNYTPYKTHFKPNMIDLTAASASLKGVRYRSVANEENIEVKMPQPQSSAGTTLVLG